MFSLFLLVLVLVFLLGLAALSAMARALKIQVAGMEEPVRIPANLGWSLLLAVLAWNFFAFEVGFGIGYGLVGACVIGAILLAFPSDKRGVDAWFLGVTGMAAALLMGLRGNEFVQAVNVLTVLACAGALLLLRSVQTVRWHALWFLKMKAGFLLTFLHHPLQLSRTLRSARASRSTLLFSVLTTAALTLVVLLFFSAILSAADPVFDTLIREVREQVWLRSTGSGILVILLLLSLTVTVPGKWQEKVPQLKVLSFMEMFVPALALVLLFGLFLAVQARYLFGTQADFQALGLTYSDYVRRGFVELLLASFFGASLSYALILKRQALDDAGKALKLRWVNGILLLELLLLLASAAKRDWMYVEAYGLTRVRVIGAIFLLWLLTIMLLMIALNVLRAMTERKFLVGAAVASALVVLLLNAVNIDELIALSAPPPNARPDIVYMSRLSEDAAEGWRAAIREAAGRYEALRAKTAFSEEEKTSLAEAKIAVTLLERKTAGLEEPRPWQEGNASRARAAALFREEPTLLRTLSCVSRSIRALQISTRTDLLLQELRRLESYASPFVFDAITYYPEPLENIDVPPPPESSGSYALPSCDGAPAS